MTYERERKEHELEADVHEIEAEALLPFSKKRRLHPAAILFQFISAIKEMLFGLGVGFIVTIKESFFIFLMFGGGFLLLLLLSSFLSWWKFTYHIKEDELRIEQGVFIRKKRYISFHRIHKIDMTANIVHRLFKLTKLQIDTASSNEGSEVILSAMKVSDASILRDVLKSERETEAEEAEETQSLTKKISWKVLFIAGTTSGSIGFILLAFLAIVPQLEEFIPWTMVSQTFQFFIALGIAFIVLAIILLLLCLWLLGIAGTMIKYGNFIIEKRENELFIKRGLLETKELTIPFDRIQAIGIEQSIIRQPLQYVKVYAVVAGGSFDKGESFPVLFPLMKKSEVLSFLTAFVPEYKINMDEIYEHLPKKSKKYYILKHTFIPFIAFCVCLYFIPSFSWIPFILVIVTLLYGNLAYKETMFKTDGKQLTFQMRRLLSKITVTTFQRRVQSLKMSENPIQRRDGLANMYISLIGSDGLGTHYDVRHLAKTDVEKSADWFSYRKGLHEIGTADHQVFEGLNEGE